MTATIDTLLELDDALTAKGFPPLSRQWWRPELVRFYTHPTATTHAARVGRGGAKSTAMCKVALNEALFGDWVIPPGERHWALFVSENRDEAANRIRLLDAYLTALGIAHETTTNAIELTKPGPLARRGFRTSACRIGGVKGWRAFWRGKDEVSAWGATDEGADPAGEVSTSMDAMSVTHPGSRCCLYSSPFGTDDLHFEAIERGDDDDQIVSIAPSWIANPDAITEEQTHKLERDEKKWRREYAAIPSANVSECFNMEHVDAAMVRVRTGVSHRAILSIDASSGGGDSFASAFAWWTFPAPSDGAFLREDVFEETDRGRVFVGHHLVVDGRGRTLLDPKALPTWRPCLIFSHLEALEGKFRGTVSADEIVERLAAKARWGNAKHVIGDQHGAFGFESSFRRFGANFVQVTYTNPSKEAAVLRVRQLLRDGQIVLPNDPQLRHELSHFREILTPSGNVRYEGRRSRDDRVAVILSAAIADAEGLIPGSPIRASGGRNNRGAEERQ